MIRRCLCSHASRRSHFAIAALVGAAIALCACSSETPIADQRNPTVAEATPSVEPSQDVAGAPLTPRSTRASDGESVARVVAGEVPHGQGRIIVTLDGEDVPVDNGARIDLGSGITTELYVDPFPPATLSLFMDVYLETDGTPVEDGFVGIEYDMLAMEHGPFTGLGTPIGGGHFIVPLDYIMFGAWDQALTIRAGDRRARLPVVIVARP